MYVKNGRIEGGKVCDELQRYWIDRDSNGLQVWQLMLFMCCLYQRKV